MTDGQSESDRPTTAGVGSEWSINWGGAIGIAVFALVALIAWRWLDGGSDGSNDAAPAATVVSTTAVTVATEVTTTTVRPTTTTSAPSTTTTTIDPAPRVDIEGEIKPCRFGDDCLVASFTIFGFDDEPDRYECIYPNSRSEFGFNDDGEDDACFTGDAGDTIAIEVDGVVSDTVSADNLDGG